MELEPAELSDAIKAVRRGLAAAQHDGNGSPVRFTVKEIVLDLGIELRHTASADGGVKAFVVSADVKGERAKTATHRMRVCQTSGSVSLSVMTVGEVIPEGCGGGGGQIRPARTSVA